MQGNFTRYIIVVSFILVSANISASTLLLDKPSYAPKEMITVQFTASAEYDRNAWVGIISSDIPPGIGEKIADQHDISFRHLEGKVSGSLTFKAPDKEGVFTLRMFDSDNDGNEVSYLSFGVWHSPATISTNKLIYEPIEDIALSINVPKSYPSNAWVGIVPDEVERYDEATNDKYKVSFQWINGKTNDVLTFKAPVNEGKYSFRLHDGDNADAKETFYAPFSVAYPETVSLFLDKEIYIPGREIRVNYEVPNSYTHRGWIGLLPAKISHGDETFNDKNDISYKYFKTPKGELLFKAPKAEGKYDFRVHNTDDNGKEIKYISFDVAYPNSATLSLLRDNFESGEEVLVNFTAPESYPGDAWAGVVPSGIEHGSEARNDKHQLNYKYLKGKTSGQLILRAPNKPGQYDVRLHTTDQNGREVSFVSFTVQDKP